jgi:hypothetical protein
MVIDEFHPIHVSEDLENAPQPFPHMCVVRMQRCEIAFMNVQIA